MTDPAKPIPRSVLLAAEKARAQRVERLKATLETALGEPIPAVDALMSELGEGAWHPELWNQLHAAAARDGKEAALAEAYRRCADGPRMKRLSPEAQTQLFMRAAEFFQAMLGDSAGAEAFLKRAVAMMPTHPEAFELLEKRLEKALDSNGLLELYAKVAATPPRPIAVLATQAQNRVLQLSAKSPLSDDACRQLLALVPVNPRLLDALDAHATATKRFPLAAELLEQALVTDTASPDPLALARRRRLIQLYMGDAATPDRAMPHVEALLARDANDQAAFDVCEKLLAARTVASRAASALRDARRARSGG